MRLPLCCEVGKPKDAEGAKNGTKLAVAQILRPDVATPIAGDYIKSEGMGWPYGRTHDAVVAEREARRVYLHQLNRWRKSARRPDRLETRTQLT